MSDIASSGFASDRVISILNHSFLLAFLVLHSTSNFVYFKEEQKIHFADTFTSTPHFMLSLNFCGVVKGSFCSIFFAQSIGNIHSLST